MEREEHLYGSSEDHDETIVVGLLQSTVAAVVM
jgi:hypothetical protein